MSMSINGQSQVPPGFRFHPTEEELLHYYLKKKVGYEKIDLDVIRDVDLNKLEPWDIQDKCRIGSTPQNDWYFFSHKDKKYPTGTRTNRATAAGFWKATGRDKIIYSNSKRIGMRKTLVFYKGRAPHGEKSDFIMHEYRLDDNSLTDNIVTNSMGEIVQEDAWVVCRVFKKKNHHKSLDSPSASNSTARAAASNQMPDSSNSALGQIFQYMGRTCKAESNSYEAYRGFRPFDALPALESPSFLDQASSSQVTYHFNDSDATVADLNPVCQTVPGLGDWGTLDRLVASHLNGETDTSKQHVCFDDFCTNSHDQDIDLWNFNHSSSSSSDPIWHVSNASV